MLLKLKYNKQKNLCIEKNNYHLVYFKKIQIQFKGL